MAFIMMKNDFNHNEIQKLEMTLDLSHNDAAALFDETLLTHWKVILCA